MELKELTYLQSKLVFQPRQKHSQNRCFLEDIPGLRECEIFQIFTFTTSTGSFSSQNHLLALQLNPAFTVHLLQVAGSDDHHS